MAPSEVVIEFGNVEVERSLGTRWDALLRINSDMSIRVRGKTIYAEAEFPVVELTVALANWRLTATEAGPDFVFSSVEADVEGLFAFEQGQHGDWQISTAEGETSDYVKLTALFGAAEAFVDGVYSSLLPKVDLREFLTDLERFTLDRVLALSSR